MSEAIPPLPNTSSWRGAQLKESIGTTLPLPLQEFKIDSVKKTLAKYKQNV
jgi:hypothetical protein